MYEDACLTSITSNGGKDRERTQYLEVMGSGCNDANLLTHIQLRTLGPIVKRHGERLGAGIV